VLTKLKAKTWMKNSAVFSALFHPKKHILSEIFTYYVLKIGSLAKVFLCFNIERAPFQEVTGYGNLARAEEMDGKGGKEM
jgi:hypothetical protein